MNLGKVIWLYLQHSPIALKTKKGNALRLLRILEVVHGSRRKPELIPLTDVTPEALRAYQNLVVNQYSSCPGEERREAVERALRSSRSVIRQARCLFSRRGECDILEIYKVNGITIPDCALDFCRCHVRGKSTQRSYHAPPDAIVERTFDAIDLMKADRSLFIGFWLAAGGLLRKNEIAACRWEFLMEVNGAPRIIGGVGKNGEEIDVPLQTRAYQAIIPFRKETGHVIEERGDGWSRRLSFWMRAQGWRTRLTLHELRAYAGSLIYRQNPVAAMRCLRHKSIQVTERNYVRYGVTAEAIDVL